MKMRFWPTLMIFVSVVVLAAEKAPPAELLQNLDFYQNMNMVQDEQFFTMTMGTATLHATEMQNVSK